MDNLRIISCNVRGLNDQIKRRQFFRNFHEKDADVIFVQETHGTKNKEKVFKNEWGGRICFDHGESNARGVAIMFAKNLEVKWEKVFKSKEGRYIIMQVKIRDKTMVLCNIYAPYTGNPSFFTKIFETISQFECDSKIIGGDFNTTLTEKDKKGGAKWNETESAKAINGLLEEQDWVDIWRLDHPEIFHYSWKKKAPLIMSRLDYFLIPKYLVNFVNSCELESNSLSDHRLVNLEISWSEVIRGRGFWKMNTLVLIQKDYVEEINKIIDMAHFQYDDLNPGLKWEMLKKDVTEFTIWYCKHRATDRRKHIQWLNKKLNSLEKKLACINLKSDRAVEIIQKVNQKIDEVKGDLLKESKIDIEGTILRSKTRYYEEGGN